MIVFAVKVFETMYVWVFLWKWRCAKVLNRLCVDYGNNNCKYYYTQHASLRRVKVDSNVPTHAHLPTPTQNIHLAFHSKYPQKQINNNKIINFNISKTLSVNSKELNSQKNNDCDKVWRNSTVKVIMTVLELHTFLFPSLRFTQNVSVTYGDAIKAEPCNPR